MTQKTITLDLSCTTLVYVNMLVIYIYIYINNTITTDNFFDHVQLFKPNFTQVLSIDYNKEYRTTGDNTPGFLVPGAIYERYVEAMAITGNSMYPLYSVHYSATRWQQEFWERSTSIIMLLHY